MKEKHEHPHLNFELNCCPRQGDFHVVPFAATTTSTSTSTSMFACACSAGVMVSLLLFSDFTVQNRLFHIPSSLGVLGSQRLCR